MPSHTPFVLFSMHAVSAVTAEVTTWPLALHASLVQALVLTGTSLAYGTDIVPPSPSHAGRWQSPFFVSVLLSQFAATPEGPAAKVLVDRSAAADLVIVGARRRTSAFGFQLGRVSHALLHHAQCPVAVVPQRQ